MNIQKVIHRLWLVCFASSVAMFSFSQTYSQLLLVAALPFFIIDNFIYNRFTLSRFEKKFYSIIGIFLGLQIVSTLVVDDPLKSLWALREEWLYIFLPISLRAFRVKSFQKPFLITFAISILAISIYGAVQHYTGVSFLSSGQAVYQSADGLYRIVGNFYNPLTFGNYIAVVSVFILTWGALTKFDARTMLMALTGVLGAIVIFFTYKRGPVFGLLLGWMTISEAMVRKNRILMIVLALLVVTAGTLLAPRFVERLSDTISTELVDEGASKRTIALRRLTVWRTSLQVIKTNPVLGVGAGNFQSAYQQNADSSATRSFSHAHNDILNIAACSGIPSVLVYLLMWTYMLRELIRHRRRKDNGSTAQIAITATLVASVTFFAASLTEVAFTKEVVRSALMVFWGIGLWGIEQDDSSEKTTEV